MKFVGDVDGNGAVAVDAIDAQHAAEKLAERESSRKAAGQRRRTTSTSCR